MMTAATLAVCLLMVALGAVVVARRLVQLALAFFGVLLATASLLAIGGADFLAVAHVMVYVGGVLVLLLFGVLVSRGREGGVPRTGVHHVLRAALVAGLLTGGLLLLGPPTAQGLPPTGGATLRGLGTALIGRYLLAFEALSVLLLVALIGAAYLARGAQASPRNTLQPKS